MSLEGEVRGERDWWAANKWPYYGEGGYITS